VEVLILHSFSHVCSAEASITLELSFKLGVSKKVGVDVKLSNKSMIEFVDAGQYFLVVFEIGLKVE